MNRLDENLLEALLGKGNLRAAWKQVKTNDGAAGIDGMGVNEAEKHLRQHWEKIEAKLRAGTYQPAAVRAVEIPKPQGGVRVLGIPTVIDRVIQQAVGQVLTEIWEPHFSVHSYGFRPGRSAHDAVKAAQKYVLEGKEWVADIDLKSFFDQVDHDILMRELSRRVRDKRVLRLIGRYPLLANIYLDLLDQELERRSVSFVRYADDIAIYASSPRAAKRILESVIEWLRKELKLEVNLEKSGSGPSDQSTLLGFRIDREGEVGIAPKALEKLQRMVREKWNARQSKTSRELRDQWQRYIAGWWEYFRIATWLRDLTDLSGWIRRHMRKCFWQGSRGAIPVARPDRLRSRCRATQWAMDTDFPSRGDESPTGRSHLSGNFFWHSLLGSRVPRSCSGDGSPSLVRCAACRTASTQIA